MITLALAAALAAPRPDESGTPDAGEVTAMALEGLSIEQQVKLQKPGAKPRVQLAFKPRPGTSTSTQMRTEQSMSMSMVGPDGTVVDLTGGDKLTPVTTIQLDTMVGEPLPNGLIPVHTSYASATMSDAPAEVVAQTEKMFASLPSFRMLVDPKSGEITQADVLTDDQQMFEVMQSMVDQHVTKLAQFPSEAIGKGAVWTVDQQIQMMGMQISSSQTVTVTEVGDDYVAYDLTLDMRRGDGELAIPGIPPDAKVDFEHFDGTGTGSMRVDLATMTYTGDMTMDMDMGMRFEMAGAPAQQMQMKMTQSTSMKRLD